MALLDDVFIAADNLDPDDVFSPKGIAVKVFSELLTRILDSVEAPNVVLRTLRKKIITETGHVIPKGATVKSTSEYDREGHVYGYGNIKFKINEVKKKERSDWTCEDVYLRVLQPKEGISEVYFIDKMIRDKRKVVSKDYDCTFVAFSPQMSFRKFTELIQISGFDYIWAEPFCVRDYTQKLNGVCMIRNVYEDIIPRFNQRVLLFENFDLHSRVSPLKQLQVGFQILCSINGDEDFIFYLPDEVKESLSKKLRLGSSELFDDVRKIRFNHLTCRDIDKDKEEVIKEKFEIQKVSTNEKALIKTDIIRPQDIEQYFDGELPFINRNVDELTDVVKQQLWNLILNHSMISSTPLLKLYHSLSTEFALDIKQESIQQVLVTGRILQELGRYEEAKDYFKIALILSKVHYGGQSVDFGARLTDIGSLYKDLGDYKSALEFFVESLNVKRAAFQGTDMSMGKTLNHIALIFEAQGRIDDAAVCQLKALDLGKVNFGRRHLEVAIALGNLGSMYSKLAEFEKSLNILNQSLELTLEVRGTWDTHTAIAFSNLAAYHSDNGNLEEAIEMQGKVLKIDREIYGRRKIEVANDLMNMATYLTMLKEDEFKIRLGISYFFQALEIQISSYGEQHLLVANTLHNLAQAFLDLDMEDDANYFGSKALEILGNVVGPEHPHYINAREMWMLEEDIGEVEEEPVDGTTDSDIMNSVSEVVAKKSSMSIKPLTAEEKKFILDPDHKQATDEGEIILSKLRSMNNEEDLTAMLQRRDSLAQYDENYPAETRLSTRSNRSSRRNKKRKSFFHGMEKQDADIIDAPDQSFLSRKSQKFTIANLPTKLQERKSMRTNKRFNLEKKGFDSQFNPRIDWGRKSVEYDEETEDETEEEESIDGELEAKLFQEQMVKKRADQRTLKRGQGTKRRKKNKRKVKRVSLKNLIIPKTDVTPAPQKAKRPYKEAEGMKDLLPSFKDIKDVLLFRT